MCIILIAYNTRSDLPLVLLANRDEYYSRPSEPARFWKENPEIHAGRDLVSGGTWLGMTKGGRFAAVTNYRDPNAPKGIASRGDIVAEFLRSEKVAEEYLETAQRRVHEFSGYNLLVGEINDRRNELYYFSNRMGSIERLPSGLYGLSNKFLDTPWPKVEKGKAALAQQLQDDPVSRDSLFNILRDESLADDESLPDTGIGYHREKSLSAIFVKTPDYGTRCSTLLTVDKNLKLDMEERVFV